MILAEPPTRRASWISSHDSGAGGEPCRAGAAIGQDADPAQEVRLTDLLLALHKGSLETPLWSGFLALLRKRLAVDYASLIFRKFDAPMNQTIRLFDSDGPRGSRGFEILERVYDPAAFPYETLPCGVPFLIEQILDPNNALHYAYLTEFLYPRGHRHMLVMRVVEPGGASALLTVSNRDRPADHAAPLFRELAEHLATAIQHLAAREQEHHRAEISTAALHRLNVGSLTFDREGGIISLDQHAHDLLERANLLRSDAQGVHQLHWPANGQQKKVLTSLLQQEKAGSRVFHLHDAPWTNLLVVPTVQQPVMGDRRPVAIGYVHGGKLLDPSQKDHLSELFGLSRSEAALAIALSNGRSITEAAAELGITVETARTYSKRIYLKTGTRGHAGMVRLILASVIMLT